MVQPEVSLLGLQPVKGILGPQTWMNGVIQQAHERVIMSLMYVQQCSVMKSMLRQGRDMMVLAAHHSYYVAWQQEHIQRSSTAPSVIWLPYMQAELLLIGCMCKITCCCQHAQ